MNDLSAAKELSEAAGHLLDNKAFKQSILDLRQCWFAELLAEQNDNRMRELKAMILALEAIPTELQIKMNDYKMALARQQKHG